MKNSKLLPSDINGYYHPEDPGEPVWRTRRLSVNDLEARFISEFMGGKTVLEIGTGLGVATRAIAEKANFVHTVDIDPWVAETIGELPSNVKFYQSLEDVDEIEFDAVFIDACHEEEHVLRDIKSCIHLVKPGGLFVFHDTNMPSVRNGIARSGLPVYAINFGAGIGIGWRNE